MPGVEAVRSADVKDELCLSGIDLNAVSISASQVSQMTNIRLKDLRKFLDGIYVTDKGVCVCHQHFSGLTRLFRLSSAIPEAEKTSR